MEYRRILKTVFLGLTLLFTASCADEVTFTRFSGFTQGTTYSITFAETRNINGEELKTAIESLLSDFDMSLSLYKDSSLLSRINRNETDELDKYTLELLNLSRDISSRTGGAFDVTVGALVKAWGFGPDEKRESKDVIIDSLLQFTGFDKIRTEGNVLIKLDSRTSLDFNAIAQGYAVDVVCSRLDYLGISDYLVEIGGEVKAKGMKGDRMWKIGIDRPVENNMIPGSDLQAVISISDRALATSGNYRKFYIEDGIKYSHTIDPRTGKPARSRLLSATILAGDCATADAFATACMVLGVEKSIEMIKSEPGLDCFLIYSGDKGEYLTWTSPGIEGLVSE